MKGGLLKVPMAIMLPIAVGVAAGLGAAAALQPSNHAAVSSPTVAVQRIEHVNAFDGAPSAAERALAARRDVQHDMEAITADTSAVPDVLLPGDRVGAVRVPLAHLGNADRAIWMYRTTRGKVCYGLTDLTAGCLAELPVGQALNPIVRDTGDGGGVIVWGFARDNVRRVDVVADGATQAAAFGRNAFFFQASSATAHISSVVATLANGSTVTETVSVPSPSADSGPLDRVLP